VRLQAEDRAIEEGGFVEVVEGLGQHDVVYGPQVGVGVVWLELDEVREPAPRAVVGAAEED
jgi:hypothetical protein